MKFATWNVNSLRVRLPQVLDWLSENPVDALCLQELKMDQDQFPLEAFTEVGYQACWAGQKTYNGVAIISRGEASDIQRNIPGYDDPQQRAIAASYSAPGGDIRVINLYCPNGEAPDSDKFVYKMEWFAALEKWLQEELAKHSRVVVLGDYNIAPADEDVHDPAAWEGKVHVTPTERAVYQDLLKLGLVDLFREFEQEEKSFTWWDYRRMAYRRNAGLRIDHILASTALAPHCSSCVIDKGPRGNTQPSDHTPVIASFNLS